MSVNDPVWSYGEMKSFQSSGATVANGDENWSYGEMQLFHELTTGNLFLLKSDINGNLNELKGNMQ
jgi:hypothetical protein